MRHTTPFHHALPVQESLFHEGLYVTHAGWELIQPQQHYPNQNHPPFYLFSWEEGRVLPAFCLAWVMEGAGEFQTRLTRRRVSKGEVFLILPGEWHRHRPLPETGWALTWIEFNGSRPYEWWKSGGFGDEVNFPQVRDAPLFAQQFERLLEHVRLHPSENSFVLSAKATGLISHLLEDASNQRKANTRDPLVDLVVEHVWNFSHGILDVPEIARHAGVGRRTLERRFRSVVGHTLLEEIQLCRFTRAARMLRETDLPMKLIVHRAGFTGYERMRQAFHNLSGHSPDSYRRLETPPPMHPSPKCT